MIKNLRRKFITITMVLVSLVLLAVFVGINLYVINNLRQDSARALEQSLNKPHGDKGPDFQVGGRIPDDFNREPTFVVLVGTDGSPTLLSAERVTVDEDTLNKITALVLEGGRRTGELTDYDLRYLMETKNGETRIAFIPLSLEKAEINRMILVTGAALVGALAIFFVVSVLLARWALKPVEEAWQRQRRFVADASHELKTPLTVILANLGILKGNPNQTVAQQMDWVENSQHEAQRMKGLVDDLLFLAKADSSNREVSMETVNLSDCVTTYALSFESVAFEQGVSIELEVEPDISVLGNEPQLKQLVGILLDNGVKYSNKGGAVTLRLGKRQGHAELSVHNQGAPISAEDQKHLFERFYRADVSRSEAGYGLGLSIAKAIVDNHNGKIAVNSTANGTVFTVSIPLPH